MNSISTLIDTAKAHIEDDTHRLEQRLANLRADVETGFERLKGHTPEDKARIVLALERARQSFADAKAFVTEAQQHSQSATIPHS